MSAPRGEWAEMFVGEGGGRWRWGSGIPLLKNRASCCACCVVEILLLFLVFIVEEDSIVPLHSKIGEENSLQQHEPSKPESRHNYE